MSVIERVLERNATYRGPERELPTPPALGLAVVTCMDSRLDVFGALGLGLGEAHIIRNAGGIVTDDVIRSLVVSQRLLGTREVMVVQHTRCGLHGLDEAAFAASLGEGAEERLPAGFGAFQDLDASVQASIALLRSCPLLIEAGHVRGFVYDVTDGRLREVA